jgi:hypothetical protein
MLKYYSPVRVKKKFFYTNKLDSIRHHIGQLIGNYVQW